MLGVQSRSICRPAPVPKSACFKQLPARSRPIVNAPQRVVRVAAARGGSPSDDPYSVLGIKATATSNEIQKAYKNKLWETKADPAGRKRVEEAHSRIMMSALTARMKGGMTVPSDIKYADRQALFPWAPKIFRANVKFVGLAALLFGACAGYSWWKNISTIVQVIAVGLLGNYVKQSALNPPPRDPEQDEEEKGIVAKNLGRAALLTVFATLPAYFVVTYLPYKLVPYYPVVADYLSHPLFVERLYFFLSTAAAVFNWIMTSFYR